MVILRDKDYMSYIVRYIDRNIGKGYNRDQLKIMLVNQGYSRAAVERALRLHDEQHPKVQHVVVKEEPKVVIPIEEAPKKRGFFARLFGLGKKKNEEEELVKVETY